MMPIPCPYHSYHSRRFYYRRFRLLREFKALLNVVPVNEAQMRWVCRALDNFEREHPELRSRIEGILEEWKPRLEAK